MFRETGLAESPIFAGAVNRRQKNSKPMARWQRGKGRLLAANAGAQMQETMWVFGLKIMHLGQELGFLYNRNRVRVAKH